MTRKLLTVKEVSKILDLKPARIYELTRERKIPFAQRLSGERLPNREYTNGNSQTNAGNKKPLKRLRTVKMSDVETKPVKW